MRIAVAGAGLMGCQIACELALGGHAVELVTRNPEQARERVEAALAEASATGMFTDAHTAKAAVTVAQGASPGFELALESVIEDFEVKVDVLRTLAAATPDAILASNTSSLRITDLGAAAGVPSRIVGMHYWNPPLLMPLVEVVPGEHTDPAVIPIVQGLLTSIGKQPVVVPRDVPGFIWNRLQFALLREALWLVENGVATADTVDLVVREGLARRWRHVGPFEAVTLGGTETWSLVGANLLPELSAATVIDGLPGRADGAARPAGAAKLARNRGLVDELLADRAREQR
jgi:3-hydroxybutyryl-CoA dehydrogenase